MYCRYCGKEIKNCVDDFCSAECEDDFFTRKCKYHCLICGTKFEGKSRKVKYCSEECRKNGARMRVKKSRANIRVINTYSGKRLAKVNADARKLHLSYGQYVARFGG